MNASIYSKGQNVLGTVEHGEGKRLGVSAGLLSGILDRPFSEKEDFSGQRL